MELENNLSEEENDINLCNNTQTTKRKLIIDSDSENDDFVSNSNENISDCNSVNLTEKCTANIDETSNDNSVNNRQNIDETSSGGSVDNINHKSKFIATCNDSESELSTTEKLSNETEEVIPNELRRISKRIAIIDSDSDVESDTVESNFKDTVTNKIPEGNSESWMGQKSLSRLCDSESSEDERDHQERLESPPPSHIPQGKSRIKTKSKPRKAPAPKKMTSKQAETQRHEIRSESQRMLRESRVSLPYHIPKTRSITEFLQKRSKFTSALVDTKLNISPSVAMKMSSKQLEIVSKRLEEREKEITKFYESESESDDNNDEVMESHDVGDKQEENKNDDAVNDDIAVESDDVGDKQEENKNDDASKELEGAVNDDIAMESDDVGDKQEENKNDNASKEFEGAVNDDIAMESDDVGDKQEKNKNDNASKEFEGAVNDDIAMESDDVGDKQEENKNDNASKELEDVEENQQDDTELQVADVVISQEDDNTGEENHKDVLKDGKINDNTKRTLENTDKTELGSDLLEEVEDEIGDTDTLEEDNNSSREKATLEQVNSTNTELIDAVLHESNFNANNSSTHNISVLPEQDTCQTSNKDFRDTINTVLGKVCLNYSQESHSNLQTKKVSLINTVAKLIKNNEEIPEAFLSSDTILLPDDDMTIPSQNKDAYKRLETMECSADSVEYDFNLDGLEEDFESDMSVPHQNDEPSINEDELQVLEPCSNENEVHKSSKEIEEDYLSRLLKKYSSVSDEQDSSNHCEKQKSKFALLKEKLGSSVPRLTIEPGQEIDLDEEIVKPSAVNLLMERFIKHTTKKNVFKNKLTLNITNLSQGEIKNEIVAMSAEPEEEPIVFLEKPGLKLKKLKNELELQMAQRRSELWKQKNLMNDEDQDQCAEDGEKSDYEAVVDEEETEMTDEDTTGSEEDEDADNDDFTEEKEIEKQKCSFLDEEAGESNKENDDEEDSSNSETESEIPDNVATKNPSKKTLVCYPADSDGSDNEVESTYFNPTSHENNASNTGLKDGSLNSTDTVIPIADEDVLPPNLPISDKTPIKTKSQFSFLTPVHHLTGLQSLNSGSKFLNESSPVSQFSVPAEPSPFKEKEWSTELQKKLFAHSCDSMDTQANSEETLSSVNEKIVNAEETVNFDTQESTQTTTQDLMDICSGSFSSCIATPKEGIVEHFGTNKLSLVSSFSNTNNVTQINLNLTEEVKNLDDDDLISQLLNEEELQQFKKKFDSPLTDAPGESRVKAKFGRVVLDSSDEEDEQNDEVKKMPQKKLDFSDDESDSEADNEEEIELHVDISGDDEDDQENNDVTLNRVIEYDSEENEIEEDQGTEIVKRSVKPREFLENEAELSESDWGSEDEDEKGLDVLEAEQGDADVFDEDEVRNDLEKIHMRRVLDQDNQEIKILQEMLLEDGELHGTGRQRQFKWRNIDEGGNEDGKNEEIDNYLDEEESEEQWRKARYEREMFLKTKEASQELVEDDELVSNDSNSQVLKLGQEALLKSLSFNVTEKPKVVPTVEVNKTFSILSTRGSFLARNDKFLTKFGEINKVNSSVTAGSVKTSKKIVFETISAEEAKGNSSINNKKRKVDDGTPKIIKKLRLSSNISPTVRKVAGKKQLF